MAAARAAFAGAGYDHVGVRELAAAAGVDPAIVIRLFGSKERLFAAVADASFSLDGPFIGSVGGMGARVARMLTGPRGARSEPNDLTFLMHSATSPVAAPILSACLHARFVEPLARQLGGRQAAARAALLTACVLGFATLRVSLGSPSLERPEITARLGAVLQACLC
jgi:AcrR family transcriptional regulator